MRRLRTTPVPALVALGFSLAASPARADLGRDVEALTLAWSAFGHVTRLEPRLLEHGDVLPLVLPISALDPKSPSCATLAVLGTSNMQFLLDPPRKSGHAPLEWPEGSVGGALELTRCGAHKPSLAALALEMRSPRGVFEFLVLSSEHEPPPLTRVLPARDPGPIAELANTAPRPRVPSLGDRVRAIEERAARERAVALTTLALTAGSLGAGSALVTLGPGCHRIAVLGDESDRRASDVDLEVRELESDEILASDDGESSDGNAFVCVAAATPVNVSFSGVAPGANVSLVHARWDLEPSLPARWPGDARAHMSRVLRTERRSLEGAPLVDESLGVQGDTLWSIEVEPGACYFALAVARHGEAESISLAAQTASNVLQSRVESGVPGAGVSFCVGAERRALLEIDADGFGLTWMSAVWQVARARLGEASR